ncbi:MAG: phosphohistidine phosphatase, SixA [Myxococcaceae bacterium]|nr:phosphohistidine phosphatase, SixA [Myxococcaceae bacterium]
MRHGPAEDDSATGRDADRALTPKGRDRVRAVAAKLLADGEAPSLIITSPLVRADETARIVREVTRLEAPLELRDELAGNGVVKEMALVIELVHGHGAQTGRRSDPSVMLVGHQPDLSELVIELTERSVAFDKAMVVAIDVAHPKREASGAPTYTLRFVLDPKTLDYRAR